MKKKKKTTINPEDENDKCFKYALTVALTYRDIEQHPERVSNIKLFINKYNWKAVNYLSKIDDWNTFSKNSPTIRLNIFYMKDNEICPA